ncbi:MAG: outer membrane beta-barrel protein [Leptolyngbya sp. SIO1E4]|nr:outer membrane beta-barrel protein [Leptolyngbya sp. SIO1E4]
MKTQLLSLMALGLTGAAVLAPAAQAQTAPTSYNYVGAGVGFGEIGDSSVGLAINSKLTLGNNVSVRPGIISDLDFSSDGETAFHVPITYDFNAISPDGKLFPYAGAGVAAITGDDSDIGPLLTAGVDYRITDKVTVNGAVNWSIYDNSQVNGVVGVGYTF